jgi:mannose-6-phosphate isomerase-like protein (cupin superfamily)
VTPDPITAATGAIIIGPGDVKIVPKPWGEERWLVCTDRYAAKLLIVREGKRLSLQYHERKHETQYLQSGRLRYTLDGRELIIEPGTTIVLAPGTVHRMEALEDACIFEVSTPELDDVVRIEDDYGRQGTSDA